MGQPLEKLRKPITPARRARSILFELHVSRSTRDAVRTITRIPGIKWDSPLGAALANGLRKFGEFDHEVLSKRK